MKKFAQIAVTSLLATGLLLAASPSFAQQAPKPEQLIKWRQSAYQVVAWNTGRVKASLDGKFDKDDVVKAANAIDAIANSGLGTLFAAGTDTGSGCCTAAGGLRAPAGGHHRPHPRQSEDGGNLPGGNEEA